MILSADPSGPKYPAAVWISLTCHAYGGSGTYAYRWRVYCSSTGALISESEPGTSNTFRVKSTSPVCADKIECVAEDGETLSASSATLTVSPVIGKICYNVTQLNLKYVLYAGIGIFANNNSAPNNSVVLGDRNNQIGTIYCTSGSHEANVGLWTDPDGSEITGMSGGTFTVIQGGGGDSNVHPYIGLQLRPGHKLNELSEGIYTCTIPDERGVSQSLYIGIYSNNFEGNDVTFLCMLTN